MEKPTRERIEEQVAHMESACIDIEESARIWRKQTLNENTFSNLYDIEVAARQLGALIGLLAPSAGE